MHRVFALVVLLVGCGGSTEITTEDYDRTCEEANDCQAVFVGDVCSCSCDVDAINYTQSTLWASERSRKQNRCDELPACEPCPRVTVDCASNTCAATLGEDTDL